MSERDAFGNPIDEKTGRPGPDAAVVGATAAVFGGAEAPAATPAPAPSAPRSLPPLDAAAASPLFTPRPAPERVKGSWDIADKLVGLFFVALFVVPFAIGGWFAYTTWHDTAKPAIGAIKSVQSSLTPTTPDPAGAPPKEVAGPPRGLGARSLLKPAALDRVLASARHDPGGPLHLLRLAPDRANLQLTRAGGGLSLVQLSWDGGRSVVQTPAGSGAGKTIIFSRIDRHAPTRLVNAAAHRLHRSTKAVDYLVLIDVVGGPGWSVYFKGGASFQGDAHGRITRRIQ